MYQYTALESAGSEFRLLRLLKGSGPDLECELSPHSLENVPHPYEALSYTWGSSELVECITLDGQLVWVTDNLHSVLRNLRLCDRDRILWVDAVCINQADTVERSQQVQQMARIYEKAEKVLFWLGKATPQIIALMESLGRVQNSYSGDRYELEMLRGWSWEDHTMAVNQLLNRDWFTRVWILQEAAKARSADVCCGVRRIPADIFVLALSSEKLKVPPHCKPVLDIMAPSFRLSSWWAQTRDLRTLLLRFQGSKASDERDKIYALLGLSSDPLDAENVAIDYRKPTAQVVHEAVAYLLLSTRADRANPFTVRDALDLMCSFTTLDVTCFAPARIVSEAYKFRRPRYERVEDTIAAATANVNGSSLLFFEERAAEDSEDKKTCYSQIVELMPDHQSFSDTNDSAGGLHILTWGDAGHRVKVVTVSDKKQAIFKAARSGCDQIVGRLLRMKLGFEGEEECEALVLQEAVEKGTARLLRTLIKAGADVNIQVPEYGSTLVVASRYCRIAMVRMLLEAGADVNAQGGVYGNALQAALAYTDADRSRSSKLNKPLVRSLREIVGILLDAGADVNARGELRRSALQAAIDSGNEEIARMLTDAGAVEND